MSTTTKTPTTVTIGADPWPDLPEWAGSLSGADDRISLAGAVAAGHADRVAAFREVCLVAERGRALRRALEAAKDEVTLAAQAVQDARDDLTKPDDVTKVLKAAAALLDAERKAQALWRAVGVGGAATGLLPDGAVTKAPNVYRPKVPGWSYQDSRLAWEWLGWARQVERATGEAPTPPAPLAHLRKSATRWQGIVQSAETLRERLADPALKIDRKAHQAHLERYQAILDGQPDPGTDHLPDIPPIWVERVTTRSAGLVPNVASTTTDEPDGIR